MFRSEYLGTRIAMLDALQRAHINPDCPEEIVPTLQRTIREACTANRLLGERGAAIGEAWARFLETRDPQAVLAFVTHAEVNRAVESLPRLIDKVESMRIPGALSMLAFKFSDTRAMTSGFEDIAQESGLINYAAGETLSDSLEAQLRVMATEAAIPARLAEAPRAVAHIRAQYDSHYGAVEAEHLGMDPLAMETATRIHPQGVGPTIGR